MKPFTVDIKVEDSSQESIHVEPVVDEDNILIGVYKLYKSPPDQFNYLGDIAFHQEYGDWEYCGDILNIEEQEQIAEGIQAKTGNTIT